MEGANHTSSRDEVMSADGCSQMPLPLCSDGDTCPFKRSCCFCKRFFFNNEPCLGGVGMVSIFRAEVYDAIPPCLESSKVSTCCSIVCKPDLLDFFILKVVDEWSDGDCIHRHGKWITWVVPSWESSVSPSMNSWMSSL